MSSVCQCVVHIPVLVYLSTSTCFHLKIRQKAPPCQCTKPAASRASSLSCHPPMQQPLMRHRSTCKHKQQQLLYPTGCCTDLTLLQAAHSYRQTDRQASALLWAAGPAKLTAVQLQPSHLKKTLLHAFCAPMVRPSSPSCPPQCKALHSFLRQHSRVRRSRAPSSSASTELHKARLILKSLQSYVLGRCFYFIYLFLGGRWLCVILNVKYIDWSLQESRIFFFIPQVNKKNLGSQDKT